MVKKVHSQRLLSDPKRGLPAFFWQRHKLRLEERLSRAEAARMEGVEALKASVEAVKKEPTAATAAGAGKRKTAARKRASAG